MLGKFSLLSLVSPDTFSCLPITSREIYLCTGSVQQAWYIFLLTHSIKVDISIYWLLSNLPDSFSVTLNIKLDICMHGSCHTLMLFMVKAIHSKGENRCKILTLNRLHSMRLWFQKYSHTHIVYQ